MPLVYAAVLPLIVPILEQCISVLLMKTHFDIHHDLDSGLGCCTIGY